MSKVHSNSGADFSQCGKYRYKLWRVWDLSKPCCLFILLNPSEADAIKNDPTVERCMHRARQTGFGGIVVCNLFAFREKNPAAMKTAKNPIGPDNDSVIVEEATKAGLVVCGWGEHGQYMGRSKAILNLLKTKNVSLYYLQLNLSGEPRHPLYVSYKQQPQLWE